MATLFLKAPRANPAINTQTQTHAHTQKSTLLIDVCEQLQTHFKTHGLYECFAMTFKVRQLLRKPEFDSSASAHTNVAISITDSLITRDFNSLPLSSCVILYHLSRFIQTRDQDLPGLRPSLNTNLISSHPNQHLGAEKSYL